MRRLPWWVGSALGLLGALFGAVLIFRPFDSLSVLIALVAVGALLMGGASIAEALRSRSGWPRIAAGLVWIVVGVAALAWPDITVRGLAIAVGVALIAGGLLDVAAGIRGSTDERLASVLGGAASVVFGVLALSWPSVTVLVVAIVFGFRLVTFGLRLAWSSFRNRRGPAAAADDRPRGKLRRSAHLAGTVVALVIALALAGVSVMLNRGEPVVDAFYDSPADVPAEPGRLLRSEEFTRTIRDDAEAWRILYTTTRAEGEPALASALVVVPAERDAGPMPVIALAHGTTGVDRTCAPSVLDDPFAAGAFFALDGVIERGWALVATDYIGLGTEGGHPYLVGEPTGRSVLDSVRAARELDGVELAEDTVVWGHSQGGGAALWTGGLAPTYGPDVGLIGVAALAPASDVVGLADTLGDVAVGSIFANYVLHGYANAYDDVRVADYVRPVARTVFDEAVGRCLSEPSALVSAIGSVALGDSVFSRDLASGPLLQRLEENVPTLPIEAPVLIAQGGADGLIVPTMQDNYVTSRCAAGQPIDYRTYPGLDHIPLVEADSPLLPDLFAWTEARFAGQADEPTCGG